MIRYSLRCAEGHGFDSWFRDSAAYDALARAGQVACAVCGSGSVEKAIMAPSVGGGGKNEPGPEPALAAPASPAEAALRALRAHVETTSDYVGGNFAAEARRIHLGDSDARSIWGEASREEAVALKDDGIPVAPLPWFSRRNS